jgi:hypothetical protein
VYKNANRTTYKNYLICSLLGTILFLSLTSLPISLSQDPTILRQNTTDDTSLTHSDQSKGFVQITKTATSLFNIVNDSTGLLGTLITYTL